MRCYIAEHETHGVKYPITNRKALYLNRKFPYVQMLCSVPENYFSAWKM